MGIQGRSQQDKGGRMADSKYKVGAGNISTKAKAGNRKGTLDLEADLF